MLRLADVEEPPFPSLSDAGYLAYFPLVAGLLTLLRTRLRAGRAVARRSSPPRWRPARSWPRCSSAWFWTRRAARSPPSPMNVAYPAGDAILLALLVGAVAIGRGAIRRAPLLLAAGLVIGAVADGIYLFQAAEGSYVEGTFLDALWPASMLCIAWPRGATRSARPRPRSPRPLLLVPLVCGGVAVAMVVLGTRSEIGTIAVVLAAATMVAVLLRLFVTLRENRTLLRLTQTEAVTDPLTGLSNRRKLLLDLDHACATLADGRTWLLALFDLDGFKQYNDSFGHPAGDALLVRLGAKLEQAAGWRRDDAYRLGGDEFCLLIPGSVETAAVSLDAAAVRWSSAARRSPSRARSGTVFLPEDARDPSEALQRADVRLYAQKRTRQARRDRSARRAPPGPLRARALARRARHEPSSSSPSRSDGASASPTTSSTSWSVSRNCTTSASWPCPTTS